jgi:hypothetical protein
MNSAASSAQNLVNSGLCAEVREGENLIPIMLDSIRMALFLYANEGNEPIPVHCRKGDMECKDCIDDENYDIARSIFLWGPPGNKKQIRKIILEHFDYIRGQWKKFHER